MCVMKFNFLFLTSRRYETILRNIYINSICLLDKDERIQFANKNHEYLIEHIQYYEEVIPNKNDFFTLLPTE